MNNLLNHFLNFFIYGLIKTINYTTWLVLRIIPDKIIFLIIKKRPWKIIRIKLNSNFKLKIRKKIKYFLNLKLKNSHRTNPCLTISITGRILFDLLGIDNNINLGLNVLAEGIKSPHAWLTSLNGEQITTGLTSSKNIKILKI